MERLEIRYNDAVKSLGTLREILEMPFSTIIRDASIQRFEYTFEVLWKFIKEYLKSKKELSAIHQNPVSEKFSPSRL